MNHHVSLFACARTIQASGNNKRSRTPLANQKHSTVILVAIVIKLYGHTHRSMDSNSFFSRLKFPHRHRQLRDFETLRKQDEGSKGGPKSNQPKRWSEIIARSSAGNASDSPTITDTQDPTGVQESGPVKGYTVQQTPNLPTSQRLWNKAYGSLENDGDTAKLVRAYVKTLMTILTTETTTADSGTDTLTEPEDPTERQIYMRKLVEEGLAKVTTTDKITKGLGSVAQFILSVKDMVDLAIQNIPQAALPWAGVCIGLQVSTFP